MGKITGKVLKTDGKTVLPDISIAVFDTEKKEIIATAKTDKDGRYILPELKPGKYRVVVAHRMVVEIEVVSENETSLASLDFLVPEAFLDPPAEEKEREGLPWYATGTARVCFIILGTTAVVLPLAWSLAKEKKVHYISPSVP